MKYSICVTVYNSEEIVKDFLRPLIDTDCEIVIVDGESSDKTAVILSDYGDRINLIKRKCSRGLGRKIAIDNSHGEYIIMTDFDIQLLDIKRIMEAYESYNSNDKILAFHLLGNECTPNVFVGSRRIFDYYDAWQDVNCMDDIYFEKVCNHFNAIKKIDFECEYKCLKIRNLTAGSESRYETDLARKLIRRVRCTSDVIFVSGFTYGKLLKFYKLKRFTGKVYGLFLYIVARILSKFIKTPSVTDKIREVETRSNGENIR
ncbi:MAG: glycosyltransferase family 2 protein [Ferroplasma sp.]|uniref:glycosyltransferase family 2 protein n=1 Tax=Ferroplasma sp. TaxID=2591003 RepID=UPI0028154D8B|nr:glycosyltransferase family 2 protein [Ferroplasma sp.]WMT50608.1 MAG: glycosyltransferase family 2 protein [Ferroplasma sp.]